MNHSKAIANHFKSKIRTLSTFELTGITNPKVFIAFCSFASKKYMYIKNYTSKPIMIGSDYMGGKSLCCEVSDFKVDMIKSSVIQVAKSASIPDFVDCLTRTNYSFVDFIEVDQSQLSIVDDYVLRPKTYKLSYSDDENYLYKYYIDEYTRHFTTTEENVLISYGVSSNTLIAAKVIDNHLYFSDAVLFERYMDKLIHHMKYTSDNGYKNSCDNTIFDIKGLLPTIDNDKLQLILKMMKDV